MHAQANPQELKFAVWAERTCSAAHCSPTECPLQLDTSVQQPLMMTSSQEKLLLAALAARTIAMLEQIALLNRRQLRKVRMTITATWAPHQPRPTQITYSLEIDSDAALSEFAIIRAKVREFTARDDGLSLKDSATRRLARSRQLVVPVGGGATGCLVVG